MLQNREYIGWDYCTRREYWIISVDSTWNGFIAIITPKIKEPRLRRLSRISPPLTTTAERQQVA